MESFVKFRNLSCAGRNANLTFTSKAGNVRVNLSVELGNLPLPPQYHLQQQPHHPYHFPHRPRNGPSRQRRRQKRAEARISAAVKATEEVSIEEAEVLALSEEAFDLSKAKKKTSRQGSCSNSC